MLNGSIELAESVAMKICQLMEFRRANLRSVRRAIGEKSIICLANDKSRCINSTQADTMTVNDRVDRNDRWALNDNNLNTSILQPSSDKWQDLLARSQWTFEFGYFVLGTLYSYCIMLQWRLLYDVMWHVNKYWASKKEGQLDAWREFFPPGNFLLH